ncbi:Single-stranded-DNA-specific exonuclease RecJ [bacterium HR29]|nr:Single-stranded-DNA-specific exonuclease RecJ [bacterium HR29]
MKGTGAALVRGRPRWKLRRPDAHRHALPRYPAVVARVLAARGITDREAARQFYRPGETPPGDPFLLPGMAEAVARTRQALKEGELIGLYGDFDVDGVTSVAVLELGLRPLGARTVRYIPDRFAEGYGLNTAALERLRGAGVSLLITADCGITSVAEIAAARRRGMDVIVLDHHTVPRELPPAVANIDPKRPDSAYPFDELAAVGVSYRFLEALYDAVGREPPVEELIDLVALGTVVDVAPLVGENRAFVRRGLDAMRRGLRPGLAALATVAGTAQRVDAEVLAYQWGPRLNAAGRLRHARLALELLLAKRVEDALPLAEELDRLNRERQRLTEEAMALAEALADGEGPLLFVGHESMHVGIVGIVAGKLAEKYCRPAIVFNRGESESRGSARSIPAFDIVTAIGRAGDLLERHGGHRAAAGFTVRNDRLPELKRRLQAYAEDLLRPEDLRPVIEIDAEAHLDELNPTELKGLLAFEPCGYGNERPVLLARGVRVADWRPVGSDGAHMRMKLKGDGAAAWPAIAFRQGNGPIADEVDVVYTLRNGREGLIELEVLDFAPAAERRPLEGADLHG